MAVQIFTSVFERIDNTVLNDLAGNTANLLGVFTPLFAACFTFYVMMVVFGYWQNRASAESSLVDVAKRLVIWGVLVGVSMNVSGYNQYVLPFVLDLGDGMAQSFNGNFESNASALDALANQLLDILTNNMEAARQVGFPKSIGAWADAVSNNLIILIFGGLFAVVAAAYILLAKFFLALLAVVGPLFLGMLMFPATRQYGMGWINQVLNYSLLLLFINVAGGFFVNYVDGILSDATGASSGNIMQQAALGQSVTLQIVLVTLLFAVILWKLPELTSGLVGGVSANGFSGLVSAATAAGRLGRFGGMGKGRAGGGGGSMSKGGAKTPEKQGTK